MTDDEGEIDWDAEFADDPDYQAMSPAQRKKLLSVMEKMIAMGMAAIYGDDDVDEPDANIDCTSCLTECNARCCTLIFALTKDEIEAGVVEYNKQRPYFIACDNDGYCLHLDRESLQCEVWENSPLRYRRYDCRGDEGIWPNGIPAKLVDAFHSK